MKKLETFDSIYFRGKSHFEDDGTQNYLVFQAVSRYFKTVSANDSNILKDLKDLKVVIFKRFSNESIKPLTSSKKNLILH